MARSPAAVPPVYFVPIGNFPRADATALASYFGHTLGLKTGVFTRFPLPSSAFNRARRQYIAE
jgi:hypothetical protein